MPEPITLLGLSGSLLGVAGYMARRYFETAKEVLDIVAGAALLVFSIPLLAACAILIKLGSSGPVWFTQVRVGKDGALFRMYKLRTMYVDAESRSGAVWAAQGDSRIVPVCRWMRRSHMDELPQLLNVIKGDMSLVGPRPERPEILGELSKQYPHASQRLSVRPGITGLAQIREGYDTSVDGFRHKLTSDLEYISRRRWTLELAILAKTIFKLNDKNAR